MATQRNPVDSSKTMRNQVDALSPYAALHKFSAGLTDRVRELDRLEREYRIIPGQGTEILTSMIENFVWTVINTLKRQEEGIDLAKIDPETIERLLKSDLLTPPQIPQAREKQ